MFALVAFLQRIVAVATPAAAASNMMQGAPLIGRPFCFRRFIVIGHLIGGRQNLRHTSRYSAFAHHLAETNPM
jgi:hypothetical protein